MSEENLQSLATGFILLHLRKSIPYTQLQVMRLCDIHPKRYYALEQGKTLFTQEEKASLLALYNITDTYLNKLIHGKLMSLLQDMKKNNI